MIFTLSCSTRNIKYDRNKILENYSNDYNIFVDNQEINLNNIFLSKNNIEYVKLDKQKRIINIKQLKSVELVEVKQMYLDSLRNLNSHSDKSKIELLVIVDGFPLKDSFKIDPKAILTFRILNKEELNNLYGERPFDGGIIITTK